MPLNVWTTWPAIECCLQSRKSYRAIYKGPCICQVWSAVNISNFKKKGTALQYWKQTSLSMLWCYKEGVKSHSEHNHSFPMIVLNEGKYETKQGDIIVILGGVKKSSLHSKKKKKKYNPSSSTHISKPQVQANNVPDTRLSDWVQRHPHLRLKGCQTCLKAVQGAMWKWD